LLSLRSQWKHYVAIDSRTNATHCDKKDAEELNLLKIDALGLTQLSVIEDCLKAIGKDHAWLVNYPLDDQKAFDVLNQRRWSRNVPVERERAPELDPANHHHRI
jgi:DNA polymerase III alpha subunit